MNCIHGDYAYIVREEFAGIVVLVDRIAWKIRATNETVWMVSSGLAGEEIQFSCSDDVLARIANIGGAESC